MGELIERTSDNMHNHPFNTRPIPETTALFWAQIAEKQFQQIMPDLGIPFPPVYTAAASSYSRIRRKIIKSSLAHYFSKLLSDDFTRLYVNAANVGKLKIYGGGYPDENIEPTCISDVPECYQPHLWKMFRILDERLNKERFWLIDEDTLEEIGSCISDMMVEKVRELARGYK